MSGAETAEVGQALGGVRALIARRMRHSLSEAAQISYFADVDMTRALELRRAWKADGWTIGIEDLIVMAVAVAVRKYPQFNASFADGLYTQHSACNVAVAISTSSGLVTPVLRDVGSLRLSEIAQQRRDIVSRALAGKLTVPEMKGGTFTISNLGLTRVRHFTPILLHPQVSILGIGRIEEAVKAAESGFSVRNIMGLSLTTDHQVLDGAPCGDFLTELCRHLEEAAFEI